MTTQLPRNVGIPYAAGAWQKQRIHITSITTQLNYWKQRRQLLGAERLTALLQAITCLDLTTLAGNDTTTNVQQLCARAKQPFAKPLLEKLAAKGQPIQDLQVAAVCVYHNLIEAAKTALGTTEIPIAAVSTGFPAGLLPLEQRLAQVRASVAAGASEIDVVISRGLALAENWEALYEEIKQMRAACGGAHLKTILATGELGSLERIYKASWVCMMAGVDFIKTSTGKEAVNATLPVGWVMTSAIYNYYQQTGFQVGFKPAGGIRTAEQALDWLTLMQEMLGTAWTQPQLFRFGASSLLNSLEAAIQKVLS